MWLRQNTLIISPHCSEAAALRKPCVSPISTMRMGRNRKMYTGMKMMNMPYQWMPSQ